MDGTPLPAAVNQWAVTSFSKMTAPVKRRNSSGLQNFDGHDSFLPNPGSDWIISDTYVISGYQYLFLYHRPTKSFVPLAKLKSTAENVSNFTGEYRVDLHPRFSRDGRTVCIDSTYEGLGRQMYTIDIGYILDHPPKR